MTAPGYVVPGGPTQAGINDQSAQAGAIEIHTEDSPATSGTTGAQLKDQVVRVASRGGLEALLLILERMDRRLAHLEEVQCGFTNETGV